MTDTYANVSDKQLADNVRASAEAYAKSLNAARAAGLTVEVQFIPINQVGYPIDDVIPAVKVSRAQTL